MSVTVALEEVKSSKKLAGIMELILLMGNYMNAGSRNEQSIGFELNYLTKVRSHYWCFVEHACVMHLLQLRVSASHVSHIAFSNCIKYN